MRRSGGRVNENRCNFCHVHTHTHTRLNPAFPIFSSPPLRPPSFTLLPQTPPRLIPQPLSSCAGFNNRLSVIHWRHLAPPPDTGHSVWVAGRPKGGMEGGRDMTLHSPDKHHDMGDSAREAEYVGKREGGCLECYFRHASV